MATTIDLRYIRSLREYREACEAAGATPDPVPQSVLSWERLHEALRAGARLEVELADAGIDDTWGLGYVGSVPVTFIGAGDLGIARVRPAADGDHFVAAPGECGRVEGGQIVLCFGHDGADDVSSWPRQGDPEVKIADN
jgi:hypothetical protein